jgi:hypothetical protein
VDDLTAAVIAVFLVLQLKHYVFDYVLQTPYQFMNKGTYGHPGGFVHAGLHAIGTILAFLVISPGLALGIAIVAGEFIIHYHVDWLKEWALRRTGFTTTDGGYWRIYGADQLAHQLTYIVITAVLAASA